MNNNQIIESVMLRGDLSVLNSQQKTDYYAKVCESVGLNPLTKPFEYIKLNGKEVLYATKGATEQLRNIHSISLKIVARDKIEDVYVVTAEAIGKDGRCDSATGAVAVGGLKGDSLANAFMKAETKAKRRVTLSICGLNMLDESEDESIPQQAKQIMKVTVVTPQSESVSEMPLKDTRETSTALLNPAIIQSHEISNPRDEYEQHMPMTYPPNPNDDFDTFQKTQRPNADYVCQAGKKYVGMTLDQIGVDTVASFIEYIEKDNLEKNKKSTGYFAEFLTKGIQYLGSEYKPYSFK